MGIALVCFPVCDINFEIDLIFLIKLFPYLFIIFQNLSGFAIFSDSFFCKSFLFFSLIKACTVFLASLYSILSTTLNLCFQNYSLSQVNNFSAISRSKHSFVLFITLIAFAGATLFITSNIFEVKSEKASFIHLKLS